MEKSPIDNFQERGGQKDREGKNIPNWMMPEERLVNKIERKEKIENFVEEKINEISDEIEKINSEKLSEVPVDDFDRNYYFLAQELLAAAQKLDRQDLYKRIKKIVDTLEKVKKQRIRNNLSQLKWKTFKKSS